MSAIARGNFEVSLSPLTLSDHLSSPGFGRLSIDKQFHGDLEATSRGEMLSAIGSAPGSAGYVALEQVTGALHGRHGSFVLQHNGIMERGEGRLTVSVVPDSGTGELAGLTGTMAILIAEGEHSYEFEYTLPNPS
jgi:hypothetical protein